MTFQRICVFCGSNSGNNPAYRAAAIELGRLLAGHDIEIVYGAGNVGLMGILADAALAAGGKVIGVIPESLMAKEVGHLGLTELRIVKSMHERKALMSDVSDAFIAMPGGFGTFEEFCEVVTWSQLGIQSKPCGLLNVEGYFDALLAFLRHSRRSGFIDADQQSMLSIAAQPEALLDTLQAISLASPGGADLTSI